MSSAWLPIPRSGYVSEPRVASTLGTGKALIQPQDGCVLGSQPRLVGVDLAELIIPRVEATLLRIAAQKMRLPQPFADSRNLKSKPRAN